MTASVNQQRAKRELRLRIGRLRRRIDGRIRSVEREGLRLVSWQTYVRRYPGYAVLAALGLGLAASAGPSGGGWSQYLGIQLVRRVIHKAVDCVWQEIKDIWAESKPRSCAAEAGGAEDGRS